MLYGTKTLVASHLKPGMDIRNAIYHHSFEHVAIAQSSLKAAGYPCKVNVVSKDILNIKGNIDKLG